MWYNAANMYAIAFDLDTNTLKESLGDNYPKAYADIKGVLVKYGFSHQQGSVYFGENGVDAVRAVTATQKLTKTFPWFAASVSDIRMLRIEDNNDLKPAIDEVLADN
jgi:virulence-associated protein VapD